jgi:hypothetical protein
MKGEVTGGGGKKVRVTGASGEALLARKKIGNGTALSLLALLVRKYKY